MKNIFALAGLVVTLLSACSERISEMQPDIRPVDMEVSVSCGTARAAGAQPEYNVNNLQILVFGKNGRLEAYGNSTASMSVKLSIFSGTKTVHAVVNAPAFKDIVDYSDFCAEMSLLSDNSLTNFVMEGRKVVSLGVRDTLIPIDVSRMVAKISLVKVENNLSGIHQSLDFVVRRAYLTNVAGNIGYSAENHVPLAPDKWYHKMGYSGDEGISDFAYIEFADASLEHSASHTDENVFYCYPNPTSEDCTDAEWKERRTRLVVEVELDGQLYYYPITLPVLEQNTHYKVSLSITRPGSGNPDTPYREDSATVSIKVLEWKKGGNIIEII